jgi:hypothetical protein
MSTPSAADPGYPATRLRLPRIASPRVRLRVLFHRQRLERLLIAGADPVSAPELSLRAFQLTRRSERRRLAASIDDTLAAAARRPRRSASAAPLARRGIRAARVELGALAEALREEPVVSARGVALARRLLTDGAGPLYTHRGDGVLRDAAGHALAALGERV